MWVVIPVLKKCNKKKIFHTLLKGGYYMFVVLLFSLI